MQRVRTKFDRLHQDPTQTSWMSIIGIRPKQLIGQYNYHDKDQGWIYLFIYHIYQVLIYII